jgi:hypothetical protein
VDPRQPALAIKKASPPKEPAAAAAAAATPPTPKPRASRAKASNCDMRKQNAVQRRWSLPFLGTLLHNKRGALVICWCASRKQASKKCKMCAGGQKASLVETRRQTSATLSMRCLLCYAPPSKCYTACARALPRIKQVTWRRPLAFGLVCAHILKFAYTRDTARQGDEGLSKRYALRIPRPSSFRCG